MHDIIKARMASAVPFVSLVGIEIIEVAPGRAVAALDQRSETSNHLATMHTGALFTLGETASGAAMSGTFASMLMQVRPVAAQADIRFLRIAKGRIEAIARTTEAVEKILGRFGEDGTARFAIEIDLTDETGANVAAMTVDWHVSRRRG